MSIKHQIHNLFKVFSGDTFTETAHELTEFTDGNPSVRPTSIGVAHANNRYTISLGYREDEFPEDPPVKIALTKYNLGALSLLNRPEDLESIMTSNAGWTDTICHELLIDGDSLWMIVMSSCGN